MYTIAKRFTFSASHIIGGLPAHHPCARLHGHNYEVEVTLRSPTLDAVGFVRDYHELSALREYGVSHPRSTSRSYLLRSILPAVYLRPSLATI
jgi:6-pyruvoyl-tetrahydropterin synthase